MYTVFIAIYVTTQPELPATVESNNNTKNQIIVISSI